MVAVEDVPLPDFADVAPAEVVAALPDAAGTRPAEVAAFPDATGVCVEEVAAAPEAEGSRAKASKLEASTARTATPDTNARSGAVERLETLSVAVRPVGGIIAVRS